MSLFVRKNRAIVWLQEVEGDLDLRDGRLNAESSKKLTLKLSSQPSCVLRIQPVIIHTNVELVACSREPWPDEHLTSTIH